MKQEKIVFVEYPKCSTCQKAKKFLEANEIEYEGRHIVEKNPSASELKKWHKKSGLPLKRFFNTSGMEYREKGLKDKLTDLAEGKWYDELASSGMLVKRPVLVGDDFVLLGFKEEEWKAKLLG